MTKYTVKIFHRTVSVADEDTWVELNTLQIEPEAVLELCELGLAEIVQDKIPAYQIVRVQKMLRLKETLGVNLTGAAVIIDLMEQVEKLKDEIAKLKRL